MCFINQSTISGADVVWRCEHLGAVTVKQIYEQGFRVVGLYPLNPVDKTYGFQFMVIEEQRR